MNPIGILIVAATALYPFVQLFSLPGITDQVALFSQGLGLMALVLMAWGQILATRLPGLEMVFGGLDRIYVLHKWAGITAMVALFVHDTVDAEMRGLGAETGLNELAETLGEISFYALLILVVISIATFIPYHLWKWTHKAMGALFALGAFHFTFIMKPFAMSDPAGLYTGLFCLAGLAAYAWTLLPERMRPARRYEVAALEETGGAVAVDLTPVGRAITPAPGQFGILGFNGAGRPEPHPFSFSRIGPDGQLRVTIKALGDFTASLPADLAVGQEVLVQGPFGRFRNDGKGPQVWVAGGIGITPILAWATALPDTADPVDLYYCVRSRAEAPHLDEVEALAAAKPNLTLHLMVSSEGQRLSASHIADTASVDLAAARVSFCGPVALRADLQAGLRRYGVGPRRFHFEEFDFRTGIGLRRLARHLAARARTRSLARG